MSEPARAVAAPTSIEDRRAERKPNSHVWHRWRRELPKRFDLGPAALELAGELARRANTAGECYGYQEGFAAATGRSRRTIRRATTDLVRAGLILYTPGRHESRKQRPEPCRFQLIALEEVRSPCPQGAVTMSAPEGGQVGQEVRSPCPQGAVTVSALTAVGTTQGTGPPRPPATRGESDRSIAVTQSYVTDHGRTRRRVVHLARPSPTDRDDWVRVRELLRGAIDESTFAMWLEDLEPIAVDADGALVVEAPAAKVGWVRARFGRVLDDCGLRASRALRFADEAAAAPTGDVVDVEHQDLEQLDLGL